MKNPVDTSSGASTMKPISTKAFLFIEHHNFSIGSKEFKVSYFIYFLKELAWDRHEKMTQASLIDDA
jgi:hypothetical protein